jgi:two-component system nitrate/nitrite response regulator NarL
MPSRAGDHVATLVVGDDQVVFLDALADVIEQHGHTVTAVARDTGLMLAYVRSQQPDLCLIHRHRPRNDDSATIAAVHAASDSTSVVMVGALAGGNDLLRALDAGMAGYVHISRSVTALVSAIERVLCGETVVDLPDAPPPRQQPEPSHASLLAARLTARERECLMMLVAGLDTTAIGARLGVSRTTVRSHMQAVLTKLGVHSRLEAASFAVRYRLVDAWAAEHPPPVDEIGPLRLRALTARRSIRPAVQRAGA